MIGRNPAGGEGDGLAHFRRTSGRSGVDLGLRDGQILKASFHAVELAGQAQQGVRPLTAHRVNDFRHRALHITLSAPRLIQERGKGFGKILGRDVEPAHGRLERRPGRKLKQKRGLAP